MQRAAWFLQTGLASQGPLNGWFNSSACQSDLHTQNFTLSLQNCSSVPSESRHGCNSVCSCWLYFKSLHSIFNSALMLRGKKKQSVNLGLRCKDCMTMCYQLHKSTLSPSKYTTSCFFCVSIQFCSISVDANITLSRVSRS